MKYTTSGIILQFLVVLVVFQAHSGCAARVASRKSTQVNEAEGDTEDAGEMPAWAVSLQLRVKELEDKVDRLETTSRDVREAVHKNVGNIEGAREAPVQLPVNATPHWWRWLPGPRPASARCP